MIIFPGAVIGAIPATLAYRGYVAVSGSNNHTHSTYTSNDASASRRLVACVGYGANEISGVTIFGVTATLVGKTDATGLRASIWIADVPTGTSGSVVLTYTSFDWESHVSLYSLVDLISSTPVSTNTATGSTSVSTSVSTTDGGIAIAAVFGLGLAASWSGVTDDVDVNPGTLMFSSASLAPTTTTTLSVVATITSGSSVAGVTASFR